LWADCACIAGISDYADIDNESEYCSISSKFGLPNPQLSRLIVI